VSRLAKVGVAGALIALAAAVAFLVMSTHGVRLIPGLPSIGAAAPHQVAEDCGPGSPAPPRLRIGVALGGSNIQAKLDTFARAVGTSPTVVEVYRPFGGAFSRALACRISKDGALPLINLSPRRQSIRAIADGQYDAYLAKYARAVKNFRLPVAISFGHEMNGNWYPWGWKRVQPADFKAAWRHIHEVFTRDGAANVIWVWSVSPKGRLSSAQALWWPGPAYVTWVGLDAYYRKPGSTFNTINRCLVSIRQFTDRPVLLTETAVAPGPHAARQVTSLFAGAASHPGVIGFVWFDQNRQERWRLEENPPALKAFRKEVAALHAGLAPTPGPKVTPSAAPASPSAGPSGG